MDFSNRFKKIWWWILLILLTTLLVARIVNQQFNETDTYIFIFWFVLVLFPIISEVSLFGFNIKKDIEAVKNELKGSISEIKNQINYQPIINVDYKPANQNEYQSKIQRELKEEKLSKDTVFSLTPNHEERRFSKNERVQERITKLSKIEEKVYEYYRKIYPGYKKLWKISDDNGIKKSVVADGLIFEEEKLKKIIEIKFIGSKLGEGFFFVIARYVSRLVDLGLKVPVLLIVVSESMDAALAKEVYRQIQLVRFSKMFNQKLPKIEVDCYLYRNDGELQKIESPKSDSVKNENVQLKQYE